MWSKPSVVNTQKFKKYIKQFLLFLLSITTEYSSISIELLFWITALSYSRILIWESSQDTVQHSITEVGKNLKKIIKSNLATKAGSLQQITLVGVQKSLE